MEDFSDIADFFIADFIVDAKLDLFSLISSSSSYLTIFELPDDVPGFYKGLDWLSTPPLLLSDPYWILALFYSFNPDVKLSDFILFN